MVRRVLHFLFIGRGLEGFPVSIFQVPIGYLVDKGEEDSSKTGSAQFSKSSSFIAGSSAGLAPALAGSNRPDP